LDFRRISVLDIINQLKRIIAKEKIKLDEQVLFTIARACDGSLRDAESILDQLAVFTKDKISVTEASALLGILQEDILFDITDQIIKKDAKAVLNLLSTMLHQGKDSNIILSNIIEHFRNLVVAKISQADTYLIDLPPEIVKRLFTQSQHFSLQELFTIFNLLVNTQEMSKRMDSSIIPLEINLIRITQEKTKGSTKTQDKPVVGLDNPKRVEKINNEKSDSQEKSCESVGNKSADETQVYNQVKENWPKIIDSISKVKMSTATFLSEGLPLKLEKDILTIALPNNCSLHKEALQKKENKLLIEKILSQLSARNLKVKFTLSLPQSKEDKVGQGNKRDSFIHSAINAFNARLI
jgi:DNA polymerase-3 subunit gamma/tau